MKLYMILYFDGQENDCDHVVAESIEDAKKIYMQIAEENEYTIESIIDVYPVLNSVGKDDTRYKIVITK